MNTTFFLFNLFDYAYFKSHNDWFILAKQRPNDMYLSLVVTAINESLKLSHIPGKTEIHHIIPRSVGGTDVPWNRVLVTLQMHQELHLTRYAVYGDPNDDLATRFRSGDPIAYAKRAKLSHRSQKKKGVGLGDSRLQASKGKIGGTKQTEAKVSKYLEKQKNSIKNFHLRGSCWVNKLVQPPLEVVYKPNEIRLIADLKKKMDEVILSCEIPLKNKFLVFLKQVEGISRREYQK